MGKVLAEQKKVRVNLFLDKDARLELRLMSARTGKAMGRLVSDLLREKGRAGK